MGDFFKGWRPKVGCVLLVIALPLMTLWIRSYTFYDMIAAKGVLILSNSGCMAWDWRGWGVPDANVIAWESENASPFSEDWYVAADGVRFPYWSAVTPLTLLSAYLILWKTRKAKGGR